MSGFGIDCDFLPAGDWSAAELSATFGRLRISLDDAIVTRVASEINGVQDDIYVPLYPLAEWIAENWWSLLSEQDLVRTGVDYDTRHRLVFARDGFALPDLSFLPLGDEVRLVWHRETLPFQRLSFIESGAGIRPVTEVRDRLWQFVERVVAQLDKAAIADTPLSLAWHQVKSSLSDAEEKAFCEATGALGLDPYDVADDIASRLIRIGRTLSAETLIELCAIANVADLQGISSWIAHRISEISAAGGRSRVLREMKTRLRLPVPSVDEAPWRVGYRAAAKLRAELGVESEGDTGNLSHLSRRWGLKRAGIVPIASADTSKASAGISAVCHVDDQSVPGFALGAGREETRKFALCRSVYNYLTGHGGSLSLVTRSFTRAQKAGRAFAAEFLAPAHRIKNLLRRYGRALTEEDFEDIAARFGVSAYVIRHQVENHALA